MQSKQELINDWKNQLKSFPATIVRTSGSSGNPLYICLNETDITNITNVGCRCLREAGLYPGIKVINTLNSCMWAGGTLDTLSMGKTGATVINFGIGNTKELIETILNLEINAISCTPSYLDKIEKVLKSDFHMNPDQLGLKLILAGGEAGVQNEDFRSRIESKWKALLIDANYGSADSVSIFASESSISKDGLVFRGYPQCDCKLLLQDGSIVLPSKGLIGELLITTNWTGGLVKRRDYRVGDIVEILSDVINHEFNFKVIGRADDMLTVKGLNIYPSTVEKVFQSLCLEYALDGNFSIYVSKNNPISEIVIASDISNEEFIDRLLKELKLHTSIDFKYLNESNLPIINGKIKKVNRVL